MTLRCYYGQIPEREGSISPSNFDGQLPDILVKCLCLAFLVNFSRLFLFLLFVRPWGCCCGWIPMCEGDIVCHCSYFWVNDHEIGPKEFIRNGVVNRKLNNIYIGLPPKVFEWFISNATKSHRADSSAGLWEGKTINTFFCLVGVLRYRNLFSHCVDRSCCIARGF